MSHPSRCDELRMTWMLAFDEGRPATGSVADHLETCPACAEFARACERARQVVSGVPLPPPDRDADFRLLAAVAAPALSATVGGPWWLPAPLMALFRERPGVALAVAGLTSFAATLIVAGTLAGRSSPATAGPVREASRPMPPSRVADAARRLDSWLEMPDPRPLPPPARAPKPSAPAPAPARRPDTSHRSPAALPAA